MTMRPSIAQLGRAETIGWIGLGAMGERTNALPLKFEDLFCMPCCLLMRVLQDIPWP